MLAIACHAARENAARLEALKAQLEARRPSDRGEAGFKAIRNHENWKFATSRFETADRHLACEVAAACDWYLGGHEMEVKANPFGGSLYVVTSKGYYHYIGA